MSAVPAQAAERKLWATVNICDTASHPNEIGIRAALPARAVLLRFRVQYRDSADGRWRWVRGANSRWHKAPQGAPVGLELRGRRRRHADPARRRELPLERREGKVVRRTRITEVGHRSSAGADPADFSAATCRIE